MKVVEKIDLKHFFLNIIKITTINIIIRMKIVNYLREH